VAAGAALLYPASPPDFGTAPAAAPVAAAPAPPPTTWAAPTAIVLRGVTSPVVAVRTEEDGRLEVPDPVTTVGWWSPSALIGASTGTTVLAGHVDSRLAGLGAFAVLRDLRPGETVEVRDIEGRTLPYSVVARQEYGKAQLPVQELFATGGPHRLVLVTCGGDFDPATRSYADNLVVIAVPAAAAGQQPVATVAG
jgi:hypothetical protein